MKKTKQSAIAEVTHNLIEKAGEKMEAVKESLIAGKNKVVATVGEKMEAAKKVIHDHTTPAKKSAKNKVAVVKKAAVRSVKKPVKKVISKTVKKVVRKTPAKKSKT
jgi:hypothetical protein